MKLGFCTAPENVPVLARYGIDRIELSVGQVEALDAAGERAFRVALTQTGVEFRSVNCLIGGFSLYDDPDFSRTKAHFERILPRLASFGVDTVVFGSGGYRKVPEGMDKDFAKARIQEFLRLLSSLLLPYGITAAVEHLPVRVCNILNTSAEAAEYVRELNLPNIRLLIDFWHFLYDGERLDVIPSYRGLLHHVHIANPIQGATPAPGDAFDTAACIRALRAADYDGTIVAETIVKGDLAEEVRGFKAVMDAGLNAK